MNYKFWIINFELEIIKNNSKTKSMDSLFIALIY